MKKKSIFKWLAIIATLLMAGMQLSAKAILPFGQWTKTPWTGKYVYNPSGEGYQEPAEGWTAADFDDSSWASIEGPISNMENTYYATEWNRSEGPGQYWVRRSFTLSEISNVHYIVASFFGDIKIFLNGREITSENNWGEPKRIYNFYVPEDYFNTGNNVLSVWVKGDENNAFLDLGLYESDNQLPREDWLTSDLNNVDYTIINDPEYPWIIEGDKIRSFPEQIGNGESRTSTLTIQFTTSKPGKFNVVWGMDGWSSTHSVFVSLDGKEISDGHSFGFDAGSHTIRIIDSLENKEGNDITEVSKIDIMEYKDWIVTPATPDGLSTSALSQGVSLSDIRCLKVTGEMNDACFTHIKQMNNLCAIDMSEANAEYIMEYTFEDKTDLTYVLLPQGLKIIGAYALHNTNIYSINIPETVNIIDEAAFYNTKLISVKIPDNVTDLLGYCFAGCSYLESVTLPPNLVSIGYLCFAGCSKLETVKLPESLRNLYQECFSGSGLKSINIPASVEVINYRAFRGTKIEEISLPPYNYSFYDQTFYDCPNLKKVTFRSVCTPEQSGMFDEVPEGLTLVVPPVSISSYRNDVYFNQYNIVAGDEINHWVIYKDFTLEDNMRTGVHPRVDFKADYDRTGHLTINGNSPLALGKTSLSVLRKSESYGFSPTIISNCNSLTADTLATVIETQSNFWHFFTPLADVKIGDIVVEYIDEGDAPESLDYVIRYYDSASRALNGTGENWINVTESTLKAGQGYILRSPYSLRVTMPGSAIGNITAFSPDNVVMNLQDYPSDFGTDKNWNLVGNPYACYFDIMNMDYPAPITVWDDNYEWWGTYQTYTVLDDEYALRPGAAFFVQKPESVSAITFGINGRQHTPEINHANGVRQLNADNGYNRFVIDLELSGSDRGKDRTRVVFNEEASLGYELTSDAAKFLSPYKEVCQIYTIDSENRYLSINERPVADGECLLGVYLPDTSQEYTISSSRVQTPVYLYDSETGSEIYLTAGAEYRFTAADRGYINNRFYLRIAPSSLNEVETAQSKVITGAGYITVEAQDGANVSVTGIDGVIYYRGEPATVNLQSGVYIVTVNGKNHKVFVK